VKLVLVVLLVAALSACGLQGPTPAPNPAPPPGAQAVASNRAAGGDAGGDLDATARAFVELVIATDHQAVKLLDLGVAHATSPDLRALAGELAATRRAELSELRGILDTAAIPYVDNHAGHDMPGMPTEAELLALSSAPDFDAEFTRLARAHLTESATVAKSGASSITHGEAKAVAVAMARERSSALRSLDALG
jgi:uncharacterized protein (DUF305 family)